MHRKTLVLLLFLFTVAVATNAASAPDSGQLLREQQPQRQLPQQLPKAEESKERQPLADSGVRVDVKAFRFSGYEGLATEPELQRVVAGFVGKSHSFGELQGVAEKVSAFLKEKGWFLARAYLPGQDVTSGTVEIAIVQGKVDGALTIKRTSSARIRDGVLRDIGKHAICPDQPLNEKRLERAVLLMNDLPGVTAKASLAAGAQPGSSGIEIDVTEGRLFTGNIWGDNYGNRYTGSWRGNGLLSINDPFRYGDQMTLMITGSEGLTSGRFGYTAPIGSRGLKANLAYTGMHYDIISGSTQSLKPEGQSHSVDAGLSYPVLRSRTANISTSLTYSFKALTDSSSNVDTSDRQINSGVIGVSGDTYDTILGGGYSTWNISATTGHYHESIADANITRTQGAFTRYNFGVTRLQRLVDRTTINLSYSGQLSGDNLGSSEKLYLGGPSGVRSYPVGEGGGDQGHIFNVDLRYDIPAPASWGSIQAAGFYDAGFVSQRKFFTTVPLGTATNKNDYWLQGAGLGVNYSFNGIFSLRSSWAHVIGDNPGRSMTGKDSDGRSEANRFWLQGMLFF